MINQVSKIQSCKHIILVGLKHNHNNWYKITTPNNLEIMTHVIYIMEVISGYILPLTSSMKVGNNDTCKWKLQIILFLYNYIYNMITNLIYYGDQYYIYNTI